MRAALSPGVSSLAIDPQRVVARWSAVALGLFAGVALLPGIILPNVAPLAVVTGCAAATLLPRLAAGPLRFDFVTPFSFFFAAIGLAYIAASLLQILPTGVLWPVRSEFILRHSFFVLPWVVLMAGTTAIFVSILPALIDRARRVAVPALIALAVADVVSAILFGVPQRMEWEGYVPFFDPPTLTLLYSTCFFVYVAVTKRIALPLAIVSVHCAVSLAISYGQMFNTMTGTVTLVGMWLFAIAIRRSARSAFLGIVGLAGVLVLGMMAGVAAPELFGFDVNTEWRFFVWRENLFASLESGWIGVGFGTPYYPLSIGNITEAYRLMRYAEFESYVFTSAIDLLYIRGQHSSFVNAFYRMGLLGGGALVAFNLAILVLLLKSLRRCDGPMRGVVAAAGAIFVLEALQIAIHVGLESPRYLTVYALAVGLARAASHLASQDSVRRPAVAAVPAAPRPDRHAPATRPLEPAHTE